MINFKFIMNGKKLSISAKNRYLAVLQILKTFPNDGNVKISQLQLTQND